MIIRFVNRDNYINRNTNIGKFNGDNYQKVIILKFDLRYI